MDLASLSKAAAKFGLGRVFPPTGRGLSDALITACARTDRVLGCGFGDTLSTNLAGSNIFNLMDTNASNFPYRFYRVIQQ